MSASEARRARQRGWTLTEIMISVAIMGILSTIGPPTFIQLQRFYIQNSARANVQRDARQSLDITNRFLRQAVASTIVIDQVSGQPPYSRIIFTTIQGENLKYWQQGRTLYAQRTFTLPGGGTSTNTSVLAKNLRYIAFIFPRSDDSSIVSVSMTMEELSYEGTTKALELSIEKVRVMN